MDIEILIIMLVILLKLLDFIKSKIRIKYIKDNMEIICAVVAFIILITGVFSLSKVYYSIFSKAPYNLTYAEALSSVTQVVSVIGGTLVAALGLYFTVKSKQKNNQDKSE